MTQFWIVLSCAAHFGYGSQNLAGAQELTVKSFTRHAIFERFDSDRDGHLSQLEKSSIREAFGDVDVPMLPDPAGGVVKKETTGHTLMGLEAADNTPADNPPTEHGVQLGRVLFYDKHLSRNDTVSCASCHLQQHGFADPRPFSSGFAGGLTRRNAMGLGNVRFTLHRGAEPGFFWDERAATLEAQVLMPIQDPVEMGMNLKDLEVKLQKLSYYPPLFEAAFGSPQVSSHRLSQAVAQFMRSMVSTNSKFDRAAPKTDDCDYSAPFADFTAQENLGKTLFIDGVGQVAEFGCAFCHMPPTFNMPKSFHNGLEISPKDRGLGELKKPANDPFTPSNDGKFKAPSLRNIALTAPYMHDGRFKTLEEVIDHYSQGVHRHPNLGLAFNEQDRESATTGYRFTVEQKAALLAFLKTLTDEQFASDPQFANPFIQLDEPIANAQCADADAESAAQQYQRLLDEYEGGAEAKDLAERFFQFAEQNSKDPRAIDALVWILTKLRNRPEAHRSLEMLAQNHVQSEKIGAACSQIGRAPSLAAEKLLRSILEKNSHAEVRAQACLSLANLLDQQGIVVDQLRDQPDSAERVLQYYGQEYGQHLRKLSRAELDSQREKVYQLMLDQFASVSTRDGTMGELARKALFTIRHLSVGRVAPEIEGEDISGVKFKLSDYRGKVVMLSFWGHW